MEKQKAITLAQELLDGEFAEANDNPKGYCQAMGWDVNGKATKKAIKKQYSLCPDKQDYEKLIAIIEDADTEDITLAAQSNAVSDFLCNCVAKHMVK